MVRLRLTQKPRQRRLGRLLARLLNRRQGLALVLAGAGGLALAGALVPARSAVFDASGWWHTSSTSVDLSPAGMGPAVGQLQISSDPGGASAIAAVRFTLDEGERPTSLRLPVASSTGTPSLVACPAGAAWRRSSGGPEAEAPTAACDVASAAVTVGDGALVVAVSDKLVRPGALDLVLVPASPSGVPPTFTLTLQPVDDTALTTRRDAASPTATEPTAATEAPTSDPGLATIDVPTTEAAAPTADAPSTPAPDTGDVSGATEAAPPLVPAVEPSRLGVKRRSPLALARAEKGDKVQDRGQRFGFVLFPIVGIVAVAALNAKRDEPRALGPLLARRAAVRDPEGAAAAAAATGPAEGGIARFRKVRTAPPERV